MPDTQFETPMMLQYLELKNNYSDCILFFRLGDFYEMFLDDAKVGAEILDITLTARDRGKDGKIPMAGIPYHALDSYLPKLVKAGYKVAICEQVGDVNAPGLVERDVVRVVTPGTLLDEHSLSSKENNFLCALAFSEKNFGIALSDLSTGTFLFTSYPRDMFRNVVGNEFSKYNPAECVLTPEDYANPEILKLIKINKSINIFPHDLKCSTQRSQEDYLKKHFKVKSLALFDLQDKPEALKACALQLSYIYYTQKTTPHQITKMERMDFSGNMLLDRSTISNLELFSTLRDGKRQGSLLNYLDKTKTSMGGRLLKTWISYPLADISKISLRHKAVEGLVKDTVLRKTLVSNLAEIPDIERLISRLSVGLGNPRDLDTLKKSLYIVHETSENLKDRNSSDPELMRITEILNDKSSKIAMYIESVIKNDPPIDIKNGGFIKESLDTRLDDLRNDVKTSKDFILDLEKKERDRTGINSLKVKYNQVFGYYIEITKANIANVPDNYIRKQTLVNAERYITPEIKHHEELILSADEKIHALELELFGQIISKVLESVDYLKLLCNSIAALDCYVSFAEIAVEKGLVIPEMTETGPINIQSSRHPVVEDYLPSGDFVPNDIYLDKNTHQLLLITGPNMAGKSVFIRQAAIIVLMAHIGCYVPAERAVIPLIDRIFVRSGASDVISDGLSTFMVEMVETAYILNNATSKSLIVMDEIGRGTSTYDGISIAWAVAEYLVSNKSFEPYVLFATHYHELQRLEEHFPKKIKNYCAVVDDTRDTPIFLHKIIKGAAAHSYGIEVAKLAGVPKKVYKKAQDLLCEFERKESASMTVPSLEMVPMDISPRISHDSVLDILNSLDLSRTTPLEALNILADIKSILEL